MKSLTSGTINTEREDIDLNSNLLKPSGRHSYFKNSSKTLSITRIDEISLKRQTALP